MKKLVLLALVLAISGIANAAVNVSTDGLTGLWRFQTSADKFQPTFGANAIVSSNSGNSGWMTGPWTAIGTPANGGLYSDGGCIQERSWDYITVNPGFVANGGGSYVNQYTIAFDYVQTSGLTGWNSLFQTAATGNAGDGDLWTDGAGHIGVGATGYSTLTYDASKWHRIVLSVDNSSFFRVYVDGVLFLDGAGQGVDGRFSLYTDKFHLFADDSWEDAWGLVGTVATWNRALSTSEVSAMGGWIDGAATPTALVIPEPITLAVLALGGLLINRK
ncbi:MAG: hypothetical protein A2Y12_07375 [Planctomycetes bacterium GWF2_42_9]|nr:MAG: hypothetical protein A2Y12_07375 [Planctomycetes bacterium GWF2_42_9]HAL44529.1 hypothetical protein [Phycisphaerales bacterium]